MCQENSHTHDWVGSCPLHGSWLVVLPCECGLPPWSTLWVCLVPCRSPMRQPSLSHGFLVEHGRWELVCCILLMFYNTDFWWRLAWFLTPLLFYILATWHRVTFPFHLHVLSQLVHGTLYTRSNVCSICTLSFGCAKMPLSLIWFHGTWCIVFSHDPSNSLRSSLYVGNHHWWSRLRLVLFFFCLSSSYQIWHDNHLQPDNKFRVHNPPPHTVTQRDSNDCCVDEVLH